PPDNLVQYPVLDIFNRLTGIALEPVPVELLCHKAELDDEVAGEVLGFDFAALFLPKTFQGRLIGAHDDAGVGASDKTPALDTVEQSIHAGLPAMSALPASLVSAMGSWERTTSMSLTSFCVV